MNILNLTICQPNRKKAISLSLGSWWKPSYSVQVSWPIGQLFSVLQRNTSSCGVFRNILYVAYSNEGAYAGLAYCGNLSYKINRSYSAFVSTSS